LNEKTGNLVWSALSPGQYDFSTTPTVAYGTVYTAASEHGGDVYAYDEATGALKWMTEVANGDDSSPVVTQNGIYVAYACPQVYDLRPKNGQVIWHYSPSCDGGGGVTPVLYDGLLFVGGNNNSTTFNSLIFNAVNGNVAGEYNSTKTPAFAHNLGFFANGSTLEAQSIPSMSEVWTVKLTNSGYYGYNSSPIVVGDVVYITTIENDLAGYDASTGKLKVMVKLANDYNDNPTSLSFGDGVMIVPAGTALVAIQGS
jgi:outer membrane protein assembly factor BamB